MDNLFGPFNTAKRDWCYCRWNTINAMEIADNLIPIGADSTTVNTGHRNSAIHLLECRLGRTLHWCVCNLHLNELPLRHLSKHLIGSTESSTNWKGPVGNAFCTWEAYRFLQQESGAYLMGRTQGRP